MCISKLCNNKLTIKCINRVIYNIDNTKEEGRKKREYKTKNKTPYKNIKKKEKKIKEQKKKIKYKI